MRDGTRHFTAFLLLLLLICRLQAMDRPRIGLVLSGGGARGFAHIGVLKMLDSLQIPVDVIAGTSMGGIAGALYAVGYSGLDLEALSCRTDWQEIFTDQPPRRMLPYFQKKETGRYQIDFGVRQLKPVTPSGLIFGQKVSLLFSSLVFPYEQVPSFDCLPCAFSCVAVDLRTGNEVILDHGSLAKAMRSTMAIPTIFSPVQWGDSLLIDGGVLNNLPVDVARAMGADIVIAVDVGPSLSERKNVNTVFTVLEQSIAMLGRDRWKENVKKADILITPDLTGYGMGDFVNSKIRAIIQQGDRAARKHVSELMDLKNTHNLQKLEDPLDLCCMNKKPLIFDVQITGQTTLPFSYVYDQIDLKPGQRFDAMAFQRHIAALKTGGVFEDVHYQIVGLSDDLIRVRVRVKEKTKPVIFGISISGQKEIRFATIYRMLRLKPNDPLDIENLNRHIMEIYALGYFESIGYDIEPVTEGSVRLALTVQEQPLRKLRIGLRYDRRHKLVVAASVLVTTPFIRGLRIENEIQFGGLSQVNYKIYYPSRTLNLPVYPFAYFKYRSIPIYIYDGFGGRIAEYWDKAVAYGAGIGLLDAKVVHLDMAYEQENTHIQPNVAFPDPEMFPAWKDRLRKFVINLDLDNLDQVFVPHRGLQLHGGYEAGWKWLGSDIEYARFFILADLYHTLHRNHTLRGFAYYGECSKGAPLYKHHYTGVNNQFAGMGFEQLTGRELSLTRLEYRYRLTAALYVKAIGNMSFNILVREQDREIRVDRYWGTGVGLQYVFPPLGYIELIVAAGSRGYRDPRDAQALWYFRMGSRF